MKNLKKKLPLIITILVVSLGVIAMDYQSSQLEYQNSLEKKQQEIIIILADNLDQFDETLAAFVDGNYKTVTASKISSEGICEFERGLAKNQDPLGNYIISYDLKNMKVLSEQVIVTNAKYFEEWQNFEEENR